MIKAVFGENSLVAEYEMSYSRKRAGVQGRQEVDLKKDTGYGSFKART